MWEPRSSLSGPVLFSLDRDGAGFLELRKLAQGFEKSNESLPCDEQKTVTDKTFISKKHGDRKLRKAGLAHWAYMQESGGDCKVGLQERRPHGTYQMVRTRAESQMTEEAVSRPSEL